MPSPLAIWIDGKPVRPGLAMRLRMAISSLTGSAYAPMVVTVTPVVNWDTRDPPELSAAADALPRFLQTHPELDETVGDPVRTATDGPWLAILQYGASMCAGRVLTDCAGGDACPVFPTVC